MKNTRLQNQLRRSGATKQESLELASVASRLHGSVPHLSATAKDQIAQQIGIRLVPVYKRPRFALAGAFVGLLILSIAAQFAQPGSPLYALKRVTQEVRVILQPSYKEDLRKEREVEQSGSTDDQRRSDDTTTDKAEDNSGSGKTGGDSSGELNDTSGSSKIEDSKTDSSGSGSGQTKIPEDKPGSSGSGGTHSQDTLSDDEPKG